jgi:hypothetical protein
MKTYKEQFDKLTEAYINDKVKPWECEACFVGNMLGGSLWSMATEYFREKDILKMTSIPFIHTCKEISIPFIENSGYTVEEVVEIEDNFLGVINNNLYLKEKRDLEAFRPATASYNYKGELPEYEDALFKAFESTLELLKEIHIKKGEIIEEVPVFTKRLQAI